MSLLPEFPPARMNEASKDKAPSSKKKGNEGDGLSKKERRALRVAQKTENASAKQIPASECQIKNNVKVTAVKSKPNVEKKAKTVISNNSNNSNAAVVRPVNCTAGKEENSVKPNVPSENSALKVDEVDFARCNKLSEGVSKAQLKAERRALQEKQRLVKAAAKLDQEDSTKKVPSKLTPNTATVKPVVLKSDHLSEHQVNLFNHLYFSSCETNEILTDVHMAFIRLGVQYSSKTILGSNARCLALLSAMKDLISDFVTPPRQEFCRSLEVALQRCVLHLQKCRPLAVSMTNALRHFKLQLTQMNANMNDVDKKSDLLQAVDVYIQDEIAKAGEAISLKVNEKITNDDIILTYGCSSLVRRLLLDAHKNGKKFKVIIIDSRPLLEGKEMLRVLISHGIDCTYLLINSASFIMNKVTKVILGAHALLANGYVMSRTGTAQVALIAQAYSKPVLVCCETYKFCERVQTDCFVYNEIGDPDMLVNSDSLEDESPLAKWRNSKFLTPLNLLYDITPTDLVTAVVTELGFLPCTSVPVVLRIRPTE